ncbi:MAG: hypothetical protein HY619_05725 [Thaumarchaeota archaeon]|nr:hypothetical protein [Nitrososphaerota archaeon]
MTSSSSFAEPQFHPTVDNLLDPLLDAIRYYSNNDFERRTLIFTWIANLVKPMAVVEVSNILGYEYRRVHDLFLKLTRSGVLSEMKDDGNYNCVGSDSLILYVRKDIIRGREAAGRIPAMFVFRKRAELDMELFWKQFNLYGKQITSYMEKKIRSLADEVDSNYRQVLLLDWSFIQDKVGRVIRILINDSIVSVKKNEDFADIRVNLRKGEIKYKVPLVKRLKSLF